MQFHGAPISHHHHPFLPPSIYRMETIRARYFNIREPFEVTAEEFEAQWPQVDNIWSLLRSGNPDNGDPWKAYTCRLFKHSESSGRKEGVPNEKRRKTKIHEAQQCFAQIKITFLATRWFASSPMERV